MLGGMDPGDHRFRPRLTAVVDVWKDVGSGDDNLCPPSGAGSTNPMLEFSKQPLGLGFPKRAGRYRPECPPFSAPVSWIVHIWKDS